MKARENPFNTENISKYRYKFADLTWEDFMGRLKDLKYRGAITGPHGTGKTTLLEDLEGKLLSEGFSVKKLRLTAEKRKFPPDFLKKFYSELTLKDIILFDGAEQMNWFSWQSFKRKTSPAGGLIITTHRPGRLPTLYSCRMSPEILQAMVEVFLGEEGKSFKEVTESLHYKHNGNIREALRELYDVFSDKK